MEKDLRQVVETRKNDTLVATTHEVDVFTVTLRKTSDVMTLKKGTILAFSNADNAYVILGTNAAGDEDLTANAILAEDVETSKSANINVTAYRQGHFNRNALIVKDGYTLTESDVLMLRYNGIYLETEI